MVAVTGFWRRAFLRNLSVLALFMGGYAWVHAQNGPALTPFPEPKPVPRAQRFPGVTVPAPIPEGALPASRPALPPPLLHRNRLHPLPL